MIFERLGLFLLAAPSAGAGPNMTQTFLFMGLIFVVFWFFMIRPQRQKQKQRELMLKSIEKGDKIVTIGGIRGSVSRIADDVVTVKVDDHCKLDFSRSAVAEVILDEKEADRRSANLKSTKKNPKKDNPKKENPQKEITVVEPEVEKAVEEET